MSKIQIFKSILLRFLRLHIKRIGFLFYLCSIDLKMMFSDAYICFECVYLKE